MKKVFLLVVSILCLTACSQKEKIKIGNTSIQEEELLELGQGAYFNIKGTKNSIFCIGDVDGAGYIFINEKLEEFEDVTGCRTDEGELDWKKEGIQQKLNEVWEYSNENYKILVHNIIVIISKHRDFYCTAKLTIIDLKTNASKSVDIEGKYGEYSIPINKN